MTSLHQLYRHSLALLTDLYQVTMAYGYWNSGLADREAVFHLFFRRCPFEGGYAIAAGLAHAADFLEQFRFDDGDLEYLASLEGNDGGALFEPGFLDYLRDMRFSCEIDAMPEGTAVFAHEPLIRVRGPLLQAQLIETPLLAIVNFQTLIATKAARVCRAAHGEPVLEFGLRRAQGIDGGLAASRAAYIGGCAGTSNVLAGKLFGIPVKGTHAHAWVMTFEDELEAFRAYARAMPNNCVFLVDTYDTLEGVRRAVQVGKELREEGHEMVGVRLDSGDLAWLSIQARQLLDDGGFPDASIVASNDLDEHIIESLERQGARIDLWGVGTKLVTAKDQPALGGVYKLAAIADADGELEGRIKLSETSAKISVPGVLNVRRFRDASGFRADVIYDEEAGCPDQPVLVDQSDPTRRKRITADMTGEDLLVPVFRGGRRVHAAPDIESIRARVQAQLDSLHQGIRRLLNPHEYPAGLESSLHARRHRMILDARGVGEEEP